jgi:small subunit ribosomal protein S21
LQVKGNNLRKALSKLKKQLQEDNKLEIFRSKQYYEKPSEKRRRKKMEGTLRAKRKQQEMTLKKDKY